MAPYGPALPSELSTHWPNLSTSSIHSAITYYTAVPYGSSVEEHDQLPLEIDPTCQTFSAVPADLVMLPRTSHKSRHDSGYAEGDIFASDTASTLPMQMTESPSFSSARASSERTSSSRRASTSTSTTSTHRPQSPTKRPRSKRPPRCTPSVPQRLPLRSHHTSPYPAQDPSRQMLPQLSHPLFLFSPPRALAPKPPPSTSRTVPEASSESLPISIDDAVRHSPPSTIHYWTSDRTRRLEYAAIDAASRGFRGFVMKLVPGCFLDAESNYRRKGFWCERKKARRRGSSADGGSVRRYRLDLNAEQEKRHGLDQEDEAISSSSDKIEQKPVEKEKPWVRSFWGR